MRQPVPDRSVFAYSPTVFNPGIIHRSQLCINEAPSFARKSITNIQFSKIPCWATKTNSYILNHIYQTIQLMKTCRPTTRIWNRGQVWWDFQSFTNDSAYIRMSPTFYLRHIQVGCFLFISVFGCVCVFFLVLPPIEGRVKLVYAAGRGLPRILFMVLRDRSRLYCKMDDSLNVNA